MVSSLLSLGLIVAVVLAAGLSSRMGRPKQTLPIRGKSMLQKVLEVFRKSRVDGVVVVLGAREREVRNKVEFKDEKVVYNPRYAEGMSGSLKLGLAEAGPWAEAVIVALGDQPYLSPSTVNRLIKAYSDSEAPVVVPVYKGRRGNPVLFDRRTFSQIMSITGDEGAKSVIKQNKNAVLEVTVEDEGVQTDIDTPDDYRKATSALGPRLIRKVKSGNVSKPHGTRPRSRQAKKAAPTRSRADL
ncbi:MAG: nucleotidyltransferase family protein [Thaumarchaeota archaeon]|nr:nucleotidyltransferase family protein [Nitrososphaerota archaeon]